MKHDDLTPEELEQLPDEFKEGLKNGTVLALPIPKPAMSNRFFTVAAAIIIGAMLSTIWVPASTLSFIGAALGALGWMFLYWFEGHKHARTKLRADITEGVLERTFDMITQAADSAKNINGTKEGEDGLTNHGPTDKDAIN